MLIVDTGPLVAAADRADKDHDACRTLLEDDEGPLVTTGLVIAEATYLINNRQLGTAAEAALYTSIIDGGLEVATGRTTRCDPHRHLGPAALHRRSASPCRGARTAALTAAAR